MNKKNIAIIFGGHSPEYGVSLESASCVIEHLCRDRYNPVPVGITQEGDWYHFAGDSSMIAGNTWFEVGNCAPAMFSPNRSKHELLVFGPNYADSNHIDSKHIEAIPIDAIFPIMHGKNCEDGTVQGLCELAGIPLVGCGTLASALTMDKDRAHKLVQAAGIAIPNSFVFEQGFEEKTVFACGEKLIYPLFVKPVKAGSSYGVTKVMESKDLLVAIKEAFLYDNEVIIEETIPGFEVGCAVMGNAELVVGEVDEIELADGFFDFTEKYNLITSKIHVPARISTEIMDEIKCTAKKIYRTLGCRGFARVDMFLKPSGEIVFNEVNTIPGFTPHSRFPGMMKAAGMSFTQVITHAIELAVTQ